MPAAAHCAICLNHFPIDGDKPEFLIFPCGHGFCSRCTDQLFTQLQQQHNGRPVRPTCPTCRKDIRKDDGHPIYLELVDTKAIFARTVVEGLDQMGPSTPLGSVKKASLKLERAIGSAPEDSDTLTAIMRALEDFNTRIIPCFEIAEKHRQEIRKLKEDLQTSLNDKQILESRLMETEVLKRENAHLNHTITKTKAERERAIQLAEKAKDEMENAFSRAERWKTKADESEVENNNFRKTIERHLNKARAQKAKYEEVVKERNALRERRHAKESQDISDSMHEYEGDYSSHETSRIHSIQQTIRSSPSRSSRRTYSGDDDIQLDCEGIPPPTFNSDWQLTTINRTVQKKRAAPGIAEGSHRRVPKTVAISLDNRGHPTRPVQLGPRTNFQIRH